MTYGLESYPSIRNIIVQKSVTATRRKADCSLLCSVKGAPQQLQTTDD